MDLFSTKLARKLNRLIKLEKLHKVEVGAVVKMRGFIKANNSTISLPPYSPKAKGNQNHVREIKARSTHKLRIWGTPRSSNQVILRNPGTP